MTGIREQQERSDKLIAQIIWAADQIGLTEYDYEYLPPLGL
jgi:hypothetical protein